MKNIREQKKGKVGKRRILALLLALGMLLSLLPLDMLPVMAAPTNPVNSTQTGYSDVVAFQNERWQNILKSTFKGATGRESAADIMNKALDTNGGVITGNTYFNWKTDAGVTPWDGTAKEVTPEAEKITYDTETIPNGNGTSEITANKVTVDYQVYNVSDASELRYALTQAKNNHTTKNSKINLLKDIDLNGSNYLWESTSFTGQKYSSGSKWLYIEGNGYTIYNMNMKADGGTSAGAGSSYGSQAFLGAMDDVKLVMKNLNFSNCLSTSNKGKMCTAIAVSIISCPSYLENVNVTNSFVYSQTAQTGSLIGRVQHSAGDTFVRNCSGSKNYIHGTQHAGGLTGCQFMLGSFKVKYNQLFPTSPEAWIGKSGQVYPEVVENSYSVDTEIFSADNDGDSGGFLSCGSKVICRNCFTNNVVYGNKKTGAFFGRVVTPESGTGGMYDDGAKQKVAIYFENCYASGSVEGQETIGGFVAFEAGKTYDTTINSDHGVAVYKNCYTTAMVGMDYAGTNLGGFIGMEETKGRKATIQIGQDESGNPVYNTNDGAVYINCYTAGEVGNITTDTSVDAMTQLNGKNRLGGFLGVSGLASKEWSDRATLLETLENGTYVNCYYDMQTTAMRERASGYSNQFQNRGAEASQIPGVTGVYTKRSDAKNIAGLVDDVKMDNNGTSVWAYDDDLYPQLQTFQANVAANFGTVSPAKTQEADPDAEKINARIQNQLNAKMNLVKNYSKASAATVLLNHWDSTMNMDTGSLGDENNWVPGLAANKLTKVDETDQTAKEYIWNQSVDGSHWEVEYKNLAAGEYEFKIQEGTAWAYNFGSDKFNGSNCKLTVPSDGDITVCFDYTGQASVAGEYTQYRIWSVFKGKDGSLVVNELGSNKDSSSIWTVAGSFGTLTKDGQAWDAQWNPECSLLNMSYVGNDRYVLTTDVIPVGTYSFKIAKDNNWGVSYGLGGSDSNMVFTLGKPAALTFEFDEATHLSSLTADVEGALTDVQLVQPAIEAKGYAVIGPRELTGYNWMENAEAVKAGAMTDDDNDGIYEKVITIPATTADGKANFGRGFGFKVVKDAVEEGHANHFYVAKPEDASITSMDVKITYDPKTDQTSYQAVNPDYASYITNIQYDSYGVLGTEELTGYNWDSDDQAADAAKAGMMDHDVSTGVYTKVYTDIPAGTHAFKVAAEGLFSTGVDYGDYFSNENYTFKTTAVSDVTIQFNKQTERITVTTDPADAMYQERYVVSGTTELTGENWNVSSTANEMKYNEETGLFEKNYQNLANGTDCVFKIVKYGLDNSRQNNIFKIEGVDGETYNLKITYDPSRKNTQYHLYKKDGTSADDYIKEPEITSWSVIGDELLTGLNWDQDVDQAAIQGEMGIGQDGWYEKTYHDIAVGSIMKNLSFKVVANGRFASGISYGNLSGGNYTFTLQYPQDTICDITIRFKEDTHEIQVLADPAECMKPVDETQFNWYLAGDYHIVSSTAFTAEKTVYDTVRDITSQFSFSPQSGLDWSVDREKNKINDYQEYCGADADGDGEGDGFPLSYTVDGKKFDGTFKKPVITIIAPTGGSNQYTCDNIMPGKQYVKATYLSNANNPESAGNRDLRLIPTVFLEAGNDATIDVIQSESDIKKEQVRNVVKYKKNTLKDVTFKEKDTGKMIQDDDMTFSYYNLAFTAGYLSTDTTGLGYYGNYNRQTINSYDFTKRRATEPKYEEGQYYAMSSAFSQTAAYSDENNHIYTDTDKTGTNLSVDELKLQSLIGNSYSDFDANADMNDPAVKKAAKTIVKIYKMNYKEDGSYTYSKVFMDSNEKADNAYHTNYLKWTGQKAFDADDAGIYYVTYFWSLADGRFRTDEKKVEIKSHVAEIDKTVDKVWIENKDDSADGKKIQYTVTYTNRMKGDFTIYDVLPYQGDGRQTDKLDENGSPVIKHSVMPDCTLSLIDANVSSTGSAATLENLQYSTADAAVNAEGNYIENPDAITRWTDVTSIPSAGEKATVLKLKGKQTADGESKITITYTVKAGDTKTGELYVNNACFDATDAVSQNTIKGYSDPVATAVTGRTISGYAFYDTNRNGRLDKDGEPRIENVTAVLQQVTKDKDGKAAYKELAQVITDHNGYYKFANITNIPDYTDTDGAVYKPYRVVFKAPDAGMVTLISKDGKDVTVAYDTLTLAKSWFPSPSESNLATTDQDIDGTRNLAEKETDTDNYYIDENLPTAEKIMQFNDSTMNDLKHYVYGCVTNYSFVRYVQNLGLLNTSSEGETYAFTLHKTDDANNPMKDVTFKIESFVGEDQDGNEIWKTVKYSSKTSENVYSYGNTDADTEAAAVATDADGNFKFDKLPAGTYRITEIAPPAGYYPEKESRTITLPYVGKAEGEISLDENDKVTIEGGVADYYKAVSLHVINKKNDKTIYVEADNATNYNYKLGTNAVNIPAEDLKLDLEKTVGITSDDGSAIVTDGTNRLFVTTKTPNVKYVFHYSNGTTANGGKVSGDIIVYSYQATDKAYVFDYGLESDIADTSTGNGLFQGGTFYNENAKDAYATTAKLNQITSAAGNKQTTITGNQNVINSDGSAEGAVTFKPVAFMDKVENYTYTANITKKNATLESNNPETGTTVNGTIKTMPASVVYYEDNFNADSTTTDGTAKIVYTGTTNPEGTSLNLTQSNGQTEQYGHDDAYKAGTGDSAGSSTKMTADGYNTRASFTFKGTGFDIVARTTTDTATIMYSIEHQTAGKWQVDKMGAVDTYYANGDLYQIPVIHEEGLDYNTYTVTLFIKEDVNKNSVVYLDGVRVYNPMGTAGNSAYIDNEEGATITKISDLVLGDGEITENGVVIRDPENPENDYTEIKGVTISNAKMALVGNVWNGDMTSFDYLEALGYTKVEDNPDMTTANNTQSILQYLHTGPNNEVYLDGNASIAFVAEGTPDSNSTLQIEAKLVNTEGIDVTTEGTAALNVWNGTALEKIEDVKTSTARYYTINLNQCIKLRDTNKYLVVISGNDPDGNYGVSFSNLKNKGYTLSNPLAEENKELVGTLINTDNVEPASVFKSFGIQSAAYTIIRNAWLTNKYTVTINSADVFAGETPKFKVYYTNNGKKTALTTTIVKTTNNEDGTVTYGLKFRAPNAVGSFPLEIHYVSADEESDEFMTTTVRVRR